MSTYDAHADTAYVVINQDFLESCGTASLVGHIMNLEGLDKMPKTVELIFEMSGLDFCVRNRGPEQYIMPDYAVYHLLESVLTLQAEGVEVCLIQVERPD